MATCDFDLDGFHHRFQQVTKFPAHASFMNASSSGFLMPAPRMARVTRPMIANA
jgi:hypothetical protein